MTKPPGAEFALSSTSRCADATSPPLELLFDLCFVVAVARACVTTSSRAHRARPRELPHRVLHDLVAVDRASSISASAYDTDDIIYGAHVRPDRGRPRRHRREHASAFAELDFTAVIGYVIRCARRSWPSAAERPCGPGRASRRASVCRGIGLVQLLWGCRRHRTTVGVRRPAGPGRSRTGHPHPGRASGLPTPWRASTSPHDRPVHEADRARRMRAGDDDRISRPRSLPAASPGRSWRPARPWCWSSACGGPISSTPAASASASPASGRLRVGLRPLRAQPPRPVGAGLRVRPTRSRRRPPRRPAGGVRGGDPVSTWSRSASCTASR